jgi:mono/diheme cytochrome c family protein
MSAFWSSIVVLLTTSLVAAPQQSLSDGVYTPEQAQRGKATFEERCRACHGDLRSSTGVRALVGDAFMADWSGLTLGDLLDRVRTMPPSQPRVLDDESYVDLVAFLLQTNGFPAGDQPLRAVAASGLSMPLTDALPVNSSIVQVLGCLSRGPGGTWALTSATGPLRTRNPDSSSGIERERLAGFALGSGSFELLYVFPSPEPFEGRRVEVKGLLVDGPEHRLNVTALAGLGSDVGCSARQQR